MFYKKHMDCLLKELLSLKAQIDEKENFFIESINNKYEYINKQITYLYESNETYEKSIKELQEKFEEYKNQGNAIVECLNHDRKDINCLIQIIKKIETKRNK